MSTSISDNTKRRGRPRTTGTGTLVGVRLQPDTLAKIDEWRARRTPVPSRPEVIREMVEAVIRMGGLNKVD